MGEIGISIWGPEWLTCSSAFYFQPQRLDHPRRRRVCSELLTLAEISAEAWCNCQSVRRAFQDRRWPHHLDPEAVEG